MIIGQFSEAYPPLRDGVGQVVHDYVTGLRDKGEDCYAIVSGAKEGYAWDKESGEDSFVLRSLMHVIPLISPYGYTAVRKDVKKKVNSLQFDIVHAHSPFMLGRYAIKTARKKGIKCVMTFHSKYRDDIKRVVKSDFITDLVIKYVVHSFNMADYVWAVNENSADVLRSYGYKGEIRVVTNFCDFKRHTKEEVENLRKEGLKYLGLAESDKILLFVGQQREEKNLSLVIKSLKKLKDEGLSLRLVSVGTGPDSNKYLTMVKELGLEDDVIFTGRIGERELLKRVYASADLFTFPSMYDTSSLVKVEAACFRVPSLLIEGATCAEGTEDGVNAFYSKNDVASYSAKIREIIENDDLRIKVGEGAERDLYKSKDDAINEIIRIYKSYI